METSRKSISPSFEPEIGRYYSRITYLVGSICRSFSILMFWFLALCLYTVWSRFLNAWKYSTSGCAFWILLGYFKFDPLAEKYAPVFTFSRWVLRLWALSLSFYGNFILWYRSNILIYCNSMLTMLVFICLQNFARENKFNINIKDRLDL